MNTPETIECPRIKALAEFLGLDNDEAQSIREDQGVYTFRHEEYLILTDEEADIAARNNIRETLWAFAPHFLINFMDDVFTEDIIATIQEAKSESCNEMIYFLVKDNFDDLVYDATLSDGRGCFLAGYDHEENESGEYFIYRTN